MTAPRPASRASLTHTGNRILYAAVAAWIIAWSVSDGGPHLGVFLIAAAAGYGLLTVLWHLTTDSNENFNAVRRFERERDVPEWARTYLNDNSEVN
ncbi:hypothetical protein QQG74_09405 [Micromonospora sp. FIMYZ51]|uniref:hypothetical protein n=1 Tax=Micromonospora sp. FIMYZ51 TaxID=3051832 RepID=UPI00312046C7